MAKVLLIGSDEQRATALARVMEQQQHFVTVCAERRPALEELKANGGGFDVVILDLSADRREDWRVLDQICGRVAVKTSAPAILCYSLVYRGPRMRLEAERRGARFIYER